jgi:hypothetical protein
MGATLLGAYVNAHTAVRVRCAAGHEVTARPHDVRKGYGFCRICARQDPATAAAAFRARLEELGVTLLEPEWLGSLVPHRATCAAGHDCRPVPSAIQQGQGPCRRCRGKEWDAFYVVTSDTGVKFGITSGDHRPRLRVHRASGYLTVVRLLTGLPGDMAPDMEDAVKAALRLTGLSPVKGREYFDLDALAVVLDIVDNYLEKEVAS